MIFTSHGFMSVPLLAKPRCTGFWDTVESLESMPYRSIVPESSRFSRETRQITYSRKGSSYSHRIIYQILEEDRLLVMVVHVRHASQDSISRHEASILQQ